MTRRVVVTGATGFIGRSLVPYLGTVGCEVEVVSRADAEQGPEAVVAHVSSLSPEVVIQLATHFLSSHSPQDIPDLIRANVEFGTVVAEAASASGARLVNIGSAWQHLGGADYRPVSLYAATKQALDTILQYYVDARGLDLRTATLFDTYGPGDVRPKLVPSLMRAARDGATLDMSDGQQLIDLTYVDDIVRGIATVALSEECPADSVLRSWAPLTIRQLVGTLAEAISRPISVNWGARLPRDREMREDWVFGESPSGWRAEVPLEAGLQRTWNAFVDAGHVT